MHIIKIMSLAIALSVILAVPAFAVDITITLTTAQATRFAAVCGAAKQLGRSCTLVESKQFAIERLRQVVVDHEGTVARKQATDAVVVPSFDPS